MTVKLLSHPGLIAVATATTAFLLTPFIAMAIQEPKFTVLETSGKFQIREYQPALVAEVETTGERDEAARKAFLILADYIFGNNRVQQKIAMTAPVTQVPEPANTKIAMTAPVMQAPMESAEYGLAGSDQPWRVAFMMPSQYSMETLPLPNDGRIKIKLISTRKLATVVFDGFSTQANLRKHRELLERFVKDRGLTPSGPYELAFYDAPFTFPWNRRNEWWVTVAP
ncbi:MAG: heme-binding protein [Alphaproteobacteria bacterium]|nr:heme-binding protein [Alphaproteobacteria bacterium]